MNLKSEGVAVAVCAGVAYLFAFAYELGYVSVWNIPVEYISINLSTFVIVATVFFLVFIPLFFCWLILVSSRLVKKPVYSWLVTSVGLLVLCPAMVVIFRSQWKLGLWTMVVFCTLGLVVVGSLLVTGESIPKQRGLGGIRLVSMLFLVLGFGGVMFYFLGRERANRRTEFLIPKYESNIVVLRHYGMDLICAPFDRGSREIKRNIIILKGKDIERLELNWERVGPLKMEKRSDMSRPERKGGDVVDGNSGFR